MGQQKNYGKHAEAREGHGNFVIHQSCTHPTRKWNGHAWPKPLYQAKKKIDPQADIALESVIPTADDMVDKEKDSVMEEVNGLSGGDNEAGFSVSSDDLLKDGEYQEGVALGLVEDTVANDDDVQTDTEKGVSEANDEAPQGDGGKLIDRFSPRVSIPYAVVVQRVINPNGCLSLA